MNLFDFTQETNEKILERGYTYYLNEQLKYINKNDSIYIFHVTHPNQYDVKIEIDTKYNILDTSCSCPYASGECKHIAAALFYLREFLLDDDSNQFGLEDEEDIFMDYYETNRYSAKLYNKVEGIVHQKNDFSKFSKLSVIYRNTINLLNQSDDSSGYLQDVLAYMFEQMELLLVDMINKNSKHIDEAFELSMQCAKSLDTDFAFDHHQMLIHFGFRDDLYQIVDQFFDQMIKINMYKTYGDYSIQAYKEMQLKMKQDYRKEEVLPFLLENQGIISFYIAYAHRLEAENKINEAIKHLIDGKEIFKISGYQTDINEALFEMYKKTQQYENIINISFDLIDYYRMKHYFELRLLLPKALWLGFVDLLILNNQNDDSFKARIYNEENRYDELLEVITNNRYLITEYNDCFNNQFEEERKQLFEMYIYDSFASTNTRFQYRKAARDVKAYYLSFKVNTIDIISLLIKKYPKRPAMADELYKVEAALKRKGFFQAR